MSQQKQEVSLIVDDVRWTRSELIAALEAVLNDPSRRPCTCGSGVPWTICSIGSQECG